MTDKYGFRMLVLDSGNSALQAGITFDVTVKDNGIDVIELTITPSKEQAIITTKSVRYLD